jgi:hypothetical protein
MGSHEEVKKFAEDWFIGLEQVSAYRNLNITCMGSHKD